VIAEFDAAVDAALEPLRGNPRLETGARVVSNLSDYGFTWSLLASAKGRRRGPARRRATRALAISGFSSLAINTAVKRVVGRARPTSAGDDPHLWVRTPTSSSFPSGHTLAAFCTAVVLADSPGETAVYVGFASTVALSRVYLRAHHASDVVGGAAIGLGLGLVGRRLHNLVSTPAARRPLKPV
jgi:undecaprenyl-diphosphatase